MSEIKPYFSYEPENGMVYFATAKEAKDHTEMILQDYADHAASFSWDESVTEICWGRIEADVVETSRIERPPEDEIDEDGTDKDGNCWADPDWKYIAEHGLRPTPPDALAEAVSVADAMSVLKRAMQEDPSYAWSWHCNLAMASYDEGRTHFQSNMAAARFMQTAFDVDVTKFDEWKAFELARIDAAREG